MGLTIVFLIAAAALSVYSLVESRGRGAINWAVALLSLALLLPRI